MPVDMTGVMQVVRGRISSRWVGCGFLAALVEHMDSARIRLEGRLEQVEAAVAAAKSVRASLRGGSPGLLGRLPERLASLESHLPHVRRLHASRQVQAVLEALRVETNGVLAEGQRLARSLGLPEPTSIQDVNEALLPHLPLRMNSRVIAKPFQLAILLAAPPIWLFVLWGRLPRGGAPVVPMLLAIWVFQLLFFLARSVRVVLTAQVLKLGQHEYPVSEIRAVHVELPGWLSRRGERAKVAVETRFGLNATIKMPNALEPFIRALRESGVRVIRTGGLW